MKKTFLVVNIILISILVYCTKTNKNDDWILTTSNLTDIGMDEWVNFATQVLRASNTRNIDELFHLSFSSDKLVDYWVQKCKSNPNLSYTPPDSEINYSLVKQDVKDDISLFLNNNSFSGELVAISIIPTLFWGYENPNLVLWVLDNSNYRNITISNVMNTDEGLKVVEWTNANPIDSKLSESVYSTVDKLKFTSTITFQKSSLLQLQTIEKQNLLIDTFADISEFSVSDDQGVIIKNRDSLYIAQFGSQYADRIKLDYSAFNITENWGSILGGGQNMTSADSDGRFPLKLNRIHSILLGHYGNYIHDPGSVKLIGKEAIEKYIISIERLREMYPYGESLPPRIKNKTKSSSISFSVKAYNAQSVILIYKIFDSNEFKSTNSKVKPADYFSYLNPNPIRQYDDKIAIKKYNELNHLEMNLVADNQFDANVDVQENKIIFFLFQLQINDNFLNLTQQGLPWSIES